MLTSADVVRHRLVSDIVDAYDRWDAAARGHRAATADAAAQATLAPIMMADMSVYVANESGVELDEVALVALARHVLDAMGVHPLAELSLMLVDDKPMERAARGQYMGEPARPTCWPSRRTTSTAAAPRRRPDDAPEALLGDVVLCPQVADAQALTAGHSPTEELTCCCTHGILHLLGYDHAEPAEEREMFAVQTRLLRRPGAARRGSHQALTLAASTS